MSALVVGSREIITKTPFSGTTKYFQGVNRKYRGMASPTTLYLVCPSEEAGQIGTWQPGKVPTWDKTYLQQYLSRGIPRVLSFRDSAALAGLLDCDPDLLHHAERPPPRTWKRKKPRPPSGASRLAAVPYPRSRSTLPPRRTRGGGSERETVRWQMPEAMIREELGEPANLRIVRVNGEAMEPALRAGDRLVVDTARRVPRTGGLFVLRQGGGFEVWRVEPVAGTDPPRLRLSCANPRYEARTCFASPGRSTSSARRSGRCSGSERPPTGCSRCSVSCAAACSG